MHKGGDYMTEQQQELTNADFAGSGLSEFARACNKLGVKPTKRQASKWRRKTGLVWKSRQKKEV